MTVRSADEQPEDRRPVSRAAGGSGTVPPAAAARWGRAVGIALLAAAPALLMFLIRWEGVAAFVGRLHMVVLHFPIALLLLALLFESLEVVSRGRWRFPATLLLFLGTTGAVAAMALGWLLMRSDAFDGAIIERHLQAGMAAAILAVITLLVRLGAGSASRAGAWSSRGLLALTCGVLIKAGHEGGSLVHGEDYLNEYAPWHEAPRREPFVFPATPVAEWDVYAQVVTPILQTRCYDCHKTQRFKGGLILDSWAALQRGGKGGAVVVPGQPDKSALLQRVTLPFHHYQHMPPRRQPQPTPEEMALLRRWIALGAPAQGTLASLGVDQRSLTAAKKLPELLQQDARPAERAEIDPNVVAKLRRPLAAEVARLQGRFPNVLGYQSRESADLELNAAWLKQKFGDDSLAAFVPVREAIGWADFSGTAITDASALAIAAMKNLRVLRLARTRVSDRTMQAIVTLPRLESLSVVDTSITADSLPARLRTLRHLYIGPPAGAGL